MRYTLGVEVRTDSGLGMYVGGACKGKGEAEARMIPRFLPEANRSGGHFLNWGYHSKTILGRSQKEHFYSKISLLKHNRNYTLSNYLYLR